MQNVIINADDYAMDAGVDAGILRLAEAGAVTAASAMALSPHWPEAARAARDAPLSLGLHFDLTSPFVEGEIPAQALPVLILRAEARLLDRGKLKREAARQLSLFDAACAAPPAFVDGHQHVHHLPGVREALLDALDDLYGSAARGIGLRICAPWRWRGLKAAIVAATGARSLARLAAARGNPVNSDFVGVYDFNPGARLGVLWEGWMAGLRGPLPLIMCHVAAPGLDGGEGDPIRLARLREFEWLASGQFQSLLRQAELAPARWPQAGAAR
jgi:predicted glycoside hydrolase/deacetylase ChbG (UPF0249 family)